MILAEILEKRRELTSNVTKAQNALNDEILKLGVFDKELFGIRDGESFSTQKLLEVIERTRKFK